MCDVSWLCYSLASYNVIFFFFFKQKTAYEMRISDWSSDVCSSDLIADGLYRGGGASGIVPLSDGACEVVAIGEGCSRFKVGDRVAGIFMQSWTAGEIADADLASALGGSIDGVLSEYRLFDERGLVSIPDALSFEEAATLPCAAVTAWNALFGMKPIDRKSKRLNSSH